MKASANSANINGSNKSSIRAMREETREDEENTGKARPESMCAAKDLASDST